MILLLFTFVGLTTGLVFNITEDAEPKHLLGFINGPSTSTDINYLIVYPDNATENALRVDEKTGELNVIGILDYETRKRYEILAVPLNGGEGIQITVNVLDVNDNSPVFPRSMITLELSEVARKGFLLALPSAEDSDSPPFDVQSYSILRGNVNNVFRLQTRRVEGQLVSSLQVNGPLDREYKESYELIVEARDGGEPPRTAELTVRILLLDVNDNAPKFNQVNYSLTINSNTTMNQPILNVSATDIDAGDNARVTYRLASIRSDYDARFSLTPNGSLYPTGTIPPGVYEMVVVAADGGSPPLEGTAFVTLTVKAPEEPVSHFDIVWLTENAEAKLDENITLGSIVARLSVMPPDPRVHLEMSGCASLCIRETDTLHVYLISVCAPFDRETTPEYQLLFSLKREQSTILDHPVMLQIRDVNDNAPVWPSSSMTIRLNRSRDDVIDLSASDSDVGDNARITYSIEGTNAVIIDSESGKVRLADKGCTPTPFISFTVVARDNGHPSLSSTLSVKAEIGQSRSAIRCALPLYETTVREDMQHGSCLLEISTWSEDGWCGSSTTKVNFSLRGDPDGLFGIDSKTGQVCIRRPLDYEKKRIHEMVVDLMEDGSDVPSDSCRISIRVEDVNDNAPLFSPLLYKTNLREGEMHPSMRLLQVSATDADEGVFGLVHYKLVSPSEGLFELNATSGELFTRQKLTAGLYRMEVVAADGGDKESIETAMVEIRVVTSSALLPQFISRSPLVVDTSEDILPGIEIGRVEAVGNSPPHYSFYSGDPSHFFSIDPDSGRITVVKYLDADAHDRVLVNVQASLPGGESAFTQVLIKIEDHNDNTPTFSSDSVPVRVREDHPIDKPFYVVSAMDKDRGKNGQITYSLLSSIPDGPFAVHPILGHLRLTSPIDYERVKLYRLLVKATDGGVPSKTANLTVLVQVVDVNDNAPIFEQALYTATIVENTPVMTRVLRVKANDVDTGLGGRVEYTLSGVDSNAFSIDPRTGDIYNRKELDREEKEEYLMNVTAMDKGVPAHSTSSSLRISVLDVNDNAPSCSSILPITISASADARKAIGTIVAHDPDAGANGTLTYRTQQHNALFLVRANGEVFVRRSLHQEEGQRLTLPVLVSDGGSPPKSTLCHINIHISNGEPSIAIEGDLNRDIVLPDECSVLPCPVTRINATGVTRWRIQSSDISSCLMISQDGLISQTSPVTSHSVRILHVVMEDNNGRQQTLNLRVHPPKFKKSNGQVVRVPTSMPIGSLVTSFGDENDQDATMTHYQLLNRTDLFELDQSTGALYIIAPLTSHIGSIMSLVVKKMTETSVTMSGVWLEIEGDLPVRPSFVDNVIRKSVLETAQIGMVVHKLSAFSSEPHSLMLYRIMDEDGVFECDPATGEISLQQKLDAYAGKEIIINGVADIDGIESSTVIVVTVQDVNNHAPVFVSSPIVSLREEASKTLPFHHVVAIDDDHGDNAKITYSIVGESTQFAIDSVDGALTMVTRLSSDAWLTVRATDNGVSSQSTDQSIHVVVEKAKWRYFDRPSQSIRIVSKHPRHPLMNFPEQKDVKMSLLPRNAPFQIADGELKTRGTITEKKYVLTAIAENPKGEMDWMLITVDIGDEELPVPKIASMSCQSVTIPENMKIKGFKRVIAASQGKNATFSIKGGNEAGQFSIDPHTGDMSCVELDRERKKEHLLVVSLKDELNSDSCTIRIRVKDENDNPPVLITKQREIVLKDAAEGSILMTLKAEDPDEGDNGRYSFELMQDPSRIIQIDKEGRIIMAKNIEYSSSQWKVKVKLFDHGPSQSLESLWELNVKDERKHKDGDVTKPMFLKQEYTAFVEEGRPRGVQILTVSSTERDSPLTYSIVQGNVDFAFDIDSHGSISTAQELDREIRKEYSLTVIATSPMFSSTMTTLVTVTVLNTNDNAPTVQTPPRRKISESTPIGTFISTISATDIDEDSILTYSIDPPSLLFAIDQYNGVIHTTAALDYEKDKAHELAIVVNDGVHQVRTILHVSILDENDNSPVFSSPFYDIVVPQSLVAHSVIGQLLATDADSDEKTHIEYAMMSNENLPFKLDSNKGLLTANDPSSLRSSYLFAVSATDNGSPPRSSIASIRVRSANGISNSPFFKQSAYRFNIAENAPAWSFIGNLSISSTPMNYRITDAPLASASFFITETGLLFSKVPLDRETQAKHQFRVEVGDAWNNLSSNSSTIVSIDVLDENDNSPIFEQINPIVISEEMQKGDIIQRLSAGDSDLSENGTVSYRIVAGNDYSVFVLDESTGALKFNEWSDAQLLSSKGSPFSWEMIIVAEDGGRPALSTLTKVRVQVSASTWRGAAPFFPLPAYHLFVQESAHVGTILLKSRPISKVGVPLDGLTYSLHESDSSLFAINPQTGVISLNGPIDYETREESSFTLSVTDAHARSAVTSVIVHVLPVDEYAPVFTKNAYTFLIPPDVGNGYTIGSVQASDQDGGRDGKVSYRISPANRVHKTIVSIDKETGEIRLNKRLEKGTNRTLEQITVIASSGPLQQSSTIVFLEMGDLPSRPVNYSFIRLSTVVIGVILIIFVGLLITLIVCVCSRCRRRTKDLIDASKKQVYSIKRDAATSQRIDIIRDSPTFISPPDPPMLRTEAVNRHSIRDLLSNRSQPDSGIDPDTCSINSSVTEYLTSIGVNPLPQSILSRNFDQPKIATTLEEQQVNELIYARVDEILTPGPLNLSRNIHMMDTTMAPSTLSTFKRTTPPTFQPLATLLAQMENTKEEKKRDYVQISV